MYTKTDLVFGFSKNQILVAVIPGLKNAEDFPRTEKRRGLCLKTILRWVYYPVSAYSIEYPEC
jgi:hypothetical protein